MYSLWVPKLPILISEMGVQEFVFQNIILSWCCVDHPSRNIACSWISKVKTGSGSLILEETLLNLVFIHFCSFMQKGVQRPCWKEPNEILVLEAKYFIRSFLYYFSCQRASVKKIVLFLLLRLSGPCFSSLSSLVHTLGLGPEGSPQLCILACLQEMRWGHLTWAAPALSFSASRFRAIIRITHLRHNHSLLAKFLCSHQLIPRCV